MEFTELQQVWDLQNTKPVYRINTAALHQKIAAKKKQALHITNFSELLVLIVNLVTGCFVLDVCINKSNPGIYLYLLAGWMLITFIFVVIGRRRRVTQKKRFDVSIQGDLDEAIATATYQVRLSHLMRWNVVPVGLLSLLSIRDAGRSPWLLAGILVFFLLTFYASKWEHNIYVRKKKGASTAA